MKMRVFTTASGIALLATGCAGPQYYTLQGPPAHPVSLKAVTFERTVKNNDWKALADVSADRAGNVYILDAATHQVAVYSPQGAPLATIGESGFWKKTFPRPSSVALDTEGRIFVADAKSDTVQVFDRTGAFSMKIGQRGVAPGNFKKPTGLDLDAARNLYVVDQGNMRVQKFDPRGIFVTQIASGQKPIEKINIAGTAGPIKYIAWPQFKLLRDIAAGSPYGIIYVLDEGVCVVHAYSSEGAYLFSFGGRGARSGKFQKPTGIAVGAMGVVCVADEKRNDMQFFDPEGRFLLSVGGRGKGFGQFEAPQGVGATPEGKFYVTDRGNRRVQIFSCAVPSSRPAGTMVKLDKPIRVAIFDFKNNNPGAQARGYGEAISEMFITAFAARPNFEVIERKQLKKVLDEIYLDQSGVVETETAKKVGKVLGIDVALAGGVAAFTSSIQVDLRLLDVETGKVILADSFEASSELQIRSLVNREVIRLENSYIVRFYPPGPPTDLCGDGGVRECSITWRANDEPDVKEYRVYRATSPSGPFTPVAKVKKPEWTDHDLTDGTEYYYALAAVDTAGLESKRSEPFSVKTRGKPVLGRMPVRPQVSVKRSSFSWQENEENVTGYVVYRSSSSGGEYSRAGESRTPQFSEGGFGSGETYYYKVAKKYRNGLESEPTEPFPVSTKPIPSVPKQIVAQGGLARRVELSWANPVESDIREFIVCRSDTKDGEYKKIASVPLGWISSPSNTDAKLSDNTTYYYKVKAIDKDNLESPLSEPLKATTKPRPSTPQGVGAAGGKARSVPLTWNRNPENDIRKYALHAAEKENGPFRELTQVSDNSFTHTGLKDLTSYHYKVRAIDRDGLVSDFSTIASATTKPRPAAPQGLVAASGMVKSARLSWTANLEKDIVRYIVSRAPGGRGSLKDVGSAAATSHLDAGLEDGAAYRYAVRACDADGLESDSSAPAEAKAKPRPVRPSGLAAEKAAGKILMRWQANPEKDIAGYEVFRSTSWDLFGGKKIGQADGIAFEDTGVKPGTNYTYWITAIDTAGLRSDQSKTISVQTPQ
ncbi:MAG: 6-bladed beta-propeller [Candidatus Aureabacteria bacterium]|nr:6-bladed beta-propeller [Candidatus Auribacterota bacterium]